LQYFIVQLLQLKLVMGFAVGNNPIFLGESVGDDVIMGSLMTQPSSKLVTWSEMRDNITCLWLEEIRLGLSVQF